jgi:hypothetical protein
MVPAGLSGYGTDWDRLALGGVTVPDLLQIDLAIGIVLILIATVIIVGRGRGPGRSRRRGEVADLDDEGTAQAPMTVVPGFSDGAAGPDPSLNGLHRAAYEPDPGGRESAGPGPEASSQASEAAGAGPGAREPAGPEREASSQASGPAGAGSGAREPAGPEREASSQASGAADTGPGPRAPAAELNGRRGPDGVVTSSGRVSSYYEGADQPVADYLAELGWDEEPAWAEEPGSRDPR